MTIGIWEPQSSKLITDVQLRSIIQTIQGVDLSRLEAELDPEFVNSNGWLMKLSQPDWAVASMLTSEQLVALIRFFTLAEMQLSGWEAASQNPVVYLVSMLKSRNEFTLELRKWIRANTDNRYLPNGALL